MPAPTVKPICHWCGLTCSLAPDGEPGQEPHGLIGAKAMGGYESTPGNGLGALDDMTTYRFNLCEFCLDHLFQLFQVPPVVQYHMTDHVDPFIPAVVRAQYFKDPRFKNHLAEQVALRDQARKAKSHG